MIKLKRTTGQRESRERALSVFVLLALIISLAPAASSCRGRSGGDADMYVKGDLTAMDLYENGYGSNMIVGFDEYGRTVEAASGRKAARDVGLFYFLWLGQPYAKDIYDVSKILAEHGKDVIFHEEGGSVSPNGQAHWWAEPLYGYYNSADEWVLRRHMELLTSAGVDFLIFDTTNCLLYENVAKTIMRISCELRAEGWDAPQVCFYTHSRSIQTINNIYETFYKSGEMKESWYCVDGRPMIIGYTLALKDRREAKSRGDNDYRPEDLSAELQEFFCVKEACWPNDDHNANSFPYTEWVYPQPLNGNMMNVSVATHPMGPFSFSLTRENWKNWGRGYDVSADVNRHEDIYRGTFFQSEWETVFASDPQPEIVMVTGWNEWIAFKQPYDGEYMLCDNADMEYSRDIEPMKGGYEDAYFIQMLANIRRYKYDSAAGTIADNVYKTVDPAGPDSQWDDVKAVYRRVGRYNSPRDSFGGAQTVRYSAPSADNNILSVRVTNDRDNLYFRIECENDVSVRDGADWMNLFIGTGFPKVKGWESYEYAVGRSRAASAPAGVNLSGTASIESLSPDFGGKNAGEAAYAVNGRFVVYSVPLSSIGISVSAAASAADVADSSAAARNGDISAVRIYFKVADGVSNPSDIMDYYCSGCSLPMGRLSFEYVFRI